MNDDPRSSGRRHAWMSVSLRPALRDMAVLVGAGAVTLFVVYVVLRYLLNALLTTRIPGEPAVFIASRPVILNALVVGVGITLAGLVVARRVGLSARLRLALSYAAFLVAAGFVVLFGVYVVLRYVPNYPLTTANPSDAGDIVLSRGAILNAVVGASGIILAALAVIGISGGWVLAGWVLRPMERINEAARIAAAGRLDHRIHLTGRNDEFRELADTFDFMLDRLHDAFTTQERFAANASHELRTPLTVMETMLDVARRDPDGQDYPALIDRLSLTNARAIGLTEALLRLADANAVTAVSEPVDLATVVRDAVVENTVEAQHLDLTVETDLAPAATVGDAALLAQLASNLVQNAIRHNYRAGIVRIATGHDLHQDTVSLRIENTGVVYTPELVAQLKEPFLRGDGRVRQRDRGERGYGLGLALAGRITEVHHGELAIEPHRGGGLIVTVTLPDAARRPN